MRYEWKRRLFAGGCGVGILLPAFLLLPLETQTRILTGGLALVLAVAGMWCVYLLAKLEPTENAGRVSESWQRGQQRRLSEHQNGVRK